MPYFDKKGKPITADEWIELFDNMKYRRMLDTSVGWGRVATVWIGVDHSHVIDGDEPPMIFETAVYGADDDEEFKEAYSNVKDATEGHKDAVEWARTQVKRWKAERMKRPVND